MRIVLAGAAALALASTGAIAEPGKGKGNEKGLAKPAAANQGGKGADRGKPKAAKDWKAKADHAGKGGVVLGEVAEQPLGLGDRAREAVEHEVGVSEGGERLGDEAVGDLVRHEAALGDVLVGLLAERGAVAAGGAEEVAGGDVGDAQRVGEALGLGAFAGAGRAEECESHAWGVSAPEGTEAASPARRVRRQPRTGRDAPGWMVSTGAASG